MKEEEEVVGNKRLIDLNFFPLGFFFLVNLCGIKKKSLKNWWSDWIEKLHAYQKKVL